MTHLVSFLYSVTQKGLHLCIERVYNMMYYRCRNILRAEKDVPLYLYVQSSVGLSLSVPWCFLGYNHIFVHRHIKMYSSSDIAIAYLIREIRSNHCFIPGFDNCELDFIVGQASKLRS